MILYEGTVILVTIALGVLTLLSMLGAMTKLQPLRTVCKTAMLIFGFELLVFVYMTVEVVKV